MSRSVVAGVLAKTAEIAITVDGRSELLSAAMVSGNFLSALGVKPAIGCMFDSEHDNKGCKGHPVVALSYDYSVAGGGDRNVGKFV